MMQARDIAEALARDAESIVRMLLPNGKRNGAEWEVGSVQGEEGHSCRVHLVGDKAGVWSDFATGERGDLLDLWAKTKGIDLGEAIREAAEHLGIRRQQFAGHTPREYHRPEKPRCHSPSGRVLTYLTENRGLSVDTLQAYKVAASADDDSVIFPYLRRSELILAKRLKLERVNGRKDIRPTEAGCEPCLFGWQAIPPSARSVAICEGEIDAMSLYQLGRPALSVPFGGGRGAKQQWIETEYEHLERFDEIFLCFDRDEEGQTAAAEIADRLGRHRCRLVEIPAPYKDPNDLLRAAHAIRLLFENARYLDPDELQSAASYVDNVIREFYPPDDEPESGFYPPWEKARGKFMFRDAELTLVSGYNGHGKTFLVGQFVLEAAAQGLRACIASMEMKPGKLLKRMATQAAGDLPDRPSEPYLRAIHDWYIDRLWIFDLVGTAKTERMLEVFRYARRRYGIRVFVVDSLLKCGIDESDYDGQKRFVEQLCDFKNEFDAHVFLVTHSRKGESEGTPSGKMDVRGAGAISDLADNGFTLWKNKAKEGELAKLEAAGETIPEDISGKPDAMLYCWKQRNGDWEKQLSLWWHPRTLQFIERSAGKPRRYVAWSQHEARHTVQARAS